MPRDKSLAVSRSLEQMMLDSGYKIKTRQFVKEVPFPGNEGTGVIHDLRKVENEYGLGTKNPR